MRVTCKASELLESGHGICSKAHLFETMHVLKLIYLEPACSKAHIFGAMLRHFVMPAGYGWELPI